MRYSYYIRVLLNYIILYPELINLKFIYQLFLLLFGRRYTSAPLTINFLITHRCNLRCKMCSFFGGKIYESEEEDVEFGDVKKVLISSKEIKPIISFGGGEPFLRKDFIDILKFAKHECNLKVVVITNGTLLTDKIIKTIDKFNLIDYFIISIYGLFNLHDEIVGLKGAFDRVISNIRKFSKKLKSRVIISSVLMRENIFFFDDFIRFFLDEGIKKIKIEHLNFLTEEENNFYQKENVFLPFTFIRKDLFEKEFIEKAWYILVNLKRKYRSNLIIKPPLSRKRFYEWYGKKVGDSNEFHRFRCVFIKHSLFINSQGEVIPCQFLRNCKIGNIKDNDFIKLWNSAMYKNIRKVISKSNFPVCFRCCK
ncbi:MAG: hypothetical protein B6D55_07665 [Candidatus Omnitrophica bacterium 4484_70.2]|nr:MAG: hypothetical protein B6D55_07665 [Candidatus Omnitrophica bacterium 4484_70.2]